MKKSQINTRVSHKNALLWLLVSASFIMSGLALVVAVTAYSTQQWQAKNDSEAIYNLTTKQALHSYCIDHNVSPCTVENMNKHAETQ